MCQQSVLKMVTKSLSPLKRTNFHWVSGYHLVERATFKPGIIITLDENGCTYMDTLLADVRECKRAINYVFVNY